MCEQPDYSEAQLAELRSRIRATPIVAASYVFLAALLAILSFTTLFGAIATPAGEPYRSVYSFAGSAMEMAVIFAGLLSPLALLAGVLAFVHSRRSFERRMEVVRWGRYALQLAGPLYMLLVAISLFSLSASIRDEHVELIIGGTSRERYSMVFIACALAALVASGILAVRWYRGWHPADCPTPPVDWSRVALCRRCGYDRGEGVSVCPECGEVASGRKSTYPDNPTDHLLRDRARRRVQSSMWFGFCFVLIPLLLFGALFALPWSLHPVGLAFVVTCLMIVGAMLAAYVRQVSREYEKELRVRDGELCPHCWYDFSGIPGEVCPECGQASIPKARKRNRETLT